MSIPKLGTYFHILLAAEMSRQLSSRYGELLQTQALDQTHTTTLTEK